MRNMSAVELLSAWERSLGQPPVHQALVLLSAAYPECAREQLAGLSIGQRDQRLLALREQLFGSLLNSVTTCPRCRQPVELTFPVSDIRIGPPVQDASADARRQAVAVATDGYRVECRVPTSLDLLSIETEGEPNNAGIGLLRRCVQSAVRERAGGDGVETIEDVGQLPATVVDTIAERLIEADPRADTRLALCCPECGHAWQATFDIAAYLFSEVHGWARRMLAEVHCLARAYGWSEADVLAMTPTRRRAYLELLGLA